MRVKLQCRLTIGKLLGHTQVQTTARYAHLALDPVSNAAERVSDFIAKQAAGSKHMSAGQCSRFKIKAQTTILLGDRFTKAMNA